MNETYAVIMAGGSGTRFWPLSRESTPKQLLRIGGENTLIQMTVRRILPLVPRERIFIVTNQRLAEDIKIQLEQKFGGSWAGNFILEPMARNTAPALGLSALHISALSPDSIMIVLAADHFIRKEKQFLDLLKQACAAAQNNYLVTLGIVPDRPETGYGYIKAGRMLKDSYPGPIRRIDAFVEKPDILKAKEYLEEGSYYWNSGMFVWKTAFFLDEVERRHLALFKGLAEIKGSLGIESEAHVTEKVFRDLQPISVDFAVMEKTDRAVVVPADIGWSDVGGWGAVFEMMERDQSGNVMKGNVIGLNCANSIIHSEGRLVAAIGLDNTVIAETKDALLVCDLDHAQEIREVVEILREKNADEHKIHKTVHRPWGNYTVLEEGPNFKVKRIVVNPGARLSLQLHEKRSEQWVVINGTATAINGDYEGDFAVGESTFISAGVRHRLENRTERPVEIIEVQTGEYLGEDDIVRLQDDYNRV